MNTLNTTGGSGFEDMEDDLPAAYPSSKAAAPVTLYKEACKACGGTGRYTGMSRHGSACFTCNGKGHHEYKTSPEYRLQQRESAARSKAKKLAAGEEAFKVAHPAVYAWLVESAESFDFARSLLGSLRQYGSLTPGQVSAAERCIAKRDSAKVAAAERVSNAQAVEAVETAFAKARSSGLLWPKLQLNGFTLSMASEISPNKGAVYVKDDCGTYMGKAHQGKFVTSRDCKPEVEATIVKLLQAPDAAAKEYGRLTGRCSVCHRKLTDPASVEAGIGPICATSFGW